MVVTVETGRAEVVLSPVVEVAVAGPHFQLEDLQILPDKMERMEGMALLILVAMEVVDYLRLNLLELMVLAVEQEDTALHITTGVLQQQVQDQVVVQPQKLLHRAG
jgi:hypothetical protein